MKAGDIKKLLEKAIVSERRDVINPHEFSVHDNFILSAFDAYRNGEPPDFIEVLINGFITTEELTVSRRVAVLKMIRDVLMGLSQPNITFEERQRLKSLLTAYFI